jgi:hypothetical protein
MRKSFVLFAVLLFAVAAFAQNVPELNEHTHHFPVQGWARPGGGGGAQNLLYHTGGKVIQAAHVVFIFWGPSFNGGAQSTYANQLQQFRNHFGTAPEYNTITQYYQNLGSGNQFIGLSNLAGGSADWFDTSTPPTNVTDATVQSEVNSYIAANGYDASAIYEVIIPPSSYSSDGSSTSCGGPSLAYCAYHGHFNNSTNGADTKYAIGPYPGCSGCQTAGFSDYQNAEHFICHETREAVTDPDLNAWFDRRGNEADDKCAWSPTPFIGSGGFAYQYEWSNAVSGCVQSQ